MAAGNLGDTVITVARTPCDLVGLGGIWWDLDGFGWIWAKFGPMDPKHRSLGREASSYAFGLPAGQAVAWRGIKSMLDDIRKPT